MHFHATSLHARKIFRIFLSAEDDNEREDGDDGGDNDEDNSDDIEDNGD